MEGTAFKDAKVISIFEPLALYDSSVDSDSGAESCEDIQCCDEENSLFSFYGALIEKIIVRYGLCSWTITTELANMVDSYKRTQNGRNPKYLDFNNLSLCVGYLHRYAICHTIMVRKAFLELFLSPPDIVRRKLEQKRLDLVFLGSGPGNDLVGFLSALYGHHDKLFEVNVTCVDQHLEWKKVLEETVDSFRGGSLGNCSKLVEDVNVITNYLVADLTDVSSWCDGMSNSLQQADVVFLVKVLSHIPDEKKFVTIQNVVNAMQAGSLLVFIDCPFYSLHFQGLTNNLDLVYGQDRNKYTVQNCRHQFGYGNIDKSTAYVRLYVKQQFF